MESFFSAVFDKAEPLLNSRWITLRNQLGVPHHIDVGTVEKVAAFAEAELSALVLHGGTGLNTGMPLTENQASRYAQIKETEKKRAAAARQQPPLQKTPGKSQAPPPVVARLTSTTAMWASPCRNWQNTGSCHRGISCLFAHKGFEPAKIAV